MYINPNNPVENTWMYHVEKLYKLVAEGGGGGGTAEEALRKANQALAEAAAAQSAAEAAQSAAEAAQAAAEAAVPTHSPAEAGKLLQVDQSGELTWVNNPAWQ